MKLTWTRTEIGGQTKPYDFAAHDGDASVGRIYRHDTSTANRGNWFWAMNAFGPGIDRHGRQCSGIVETKADAARLVEEAYLACTGADAMKPTIFVDHSNKPKPEVDMTYVVEHFDEGHWTTLMTLKDRKKAYSMAKGLGKHGRVVETRSRKTRK